jgi:hypothetical protein
LSARGRKASAVSGEDGDRSREEDKKGKEGRKGREEGREEEGKKDSKEGEKRENLHVTGRLPPPSVGRMEIGVGKRISKEGR